MFRIINQRLLALCCFHKQVLKYIFGYNTYAKNVSYFYVKIKYQVNGDPDFSAEHNWHVLRDFSN